MAVIDPDLDAYAEAHTTPSPEPFARLAAETHETTSAPQMMVGEVAGRFLELFVRALDAKRVLEIGTFTGYSSLSMARGLPEGGTLVSCDVNEETTSVARRYAEELGVSDRIDYLLGHGVDSIERLEGPFDLVFIDADKPGYVAYYEAALPKVRHGGFLIADNALQGGRVVEDDDAPNVQAIRAFNDHVRNDARVECVMLTIRDGMLLIRKR